MLQKITQQQLFNALVEYKYIVFKDGQLIVTQDFYRDFSDPLKLLVKQEIKKAAEAAELSILPPSEGLVINSIAIEKLPDSILTKFIVDAGVPPAYKMKGGTYSLNKFNSKAEKILIKLLKEKINYEVLVMSAKIYYKSGVIPKTIANYFLEGIWKDEYNTLVDKISQGEKVAQAYVSNSLKEGDVNENGSSRYKR